MLIKKTTTLCFVLSLILCLTLSAQEEDDVSLFYQKSTKNTIKNTLSTDVISIISGEFPLIWGHKFTKHFQLELGLGALLPYYVNMNPLSDFGTFDEDTPTAPFTNDKFGFSFLISAKSFLIPSSTGGFYSDIVLHYRHYSTVGVWQLGFGGGWQQTVFDRFFFDLGLNFSFLNQNSFDGETFFYQEGPLGLGSSFDFMVKLGYIIN